MDYRNEKTECEEMSGSKEGKAVSTTKLSTQEIETSGKRRRALLASRALGADSPKGEKFE